MAIESAARSAAGGAEIVDNRGIQMLDKQGYPAITNGG